jgi:hypothetical protein
MHIIWSLIFRVLLLRLDFALFCGGMAPSSYELPQRLLINLRGFVTLVTYDDLGLSPLTSRGSSPPDHKISSHCSLFLVLPRPRRSFVGRYEAGQTSHHAITVVCFRAWSSDDGDGRSCCGVSSSDNHIQETETLSFRQERLGRKQ